MMPAALGRGLGLGRRGLVWSNSDTESDTESDTDSSIGSVTVTQDLLSKNSVADDNNETGSTTSRGRSSQDWGLQK